jgi:acetolactate synthase-1/2/3 large subunit
VPDTLLGGGAGEYQTMPEHHGGVAVAEALAAAGVDRLFFLPGGHVAPVIAGCRALSIDVLSTRHESAAVFMAEGWARTTGRTGVAAVTAGPGFTNGVTGLANAQSTGIPVAVLGGRTPLALRGRGAVQDAPQEAVARAVCKWAREVTRPEQLGVSVREALAQARAARCGSAYLDLPTDVLTAEAPRYEGGAVGTVRVSHADGGLVDAAVELLAGAERPVVVAGGGAFWAGAADALQRFAETTGIPVTTTSHARGLLPDSHPACLGSLLHGGVGVAFADVVLIVGSRFNGNLLFGDSPLWQPHQRIIQIDADPAGLALNRLPEIGLLGDAAVVLDQLADAWTGAPKKAWCEEAKGYADGSMEHWIGEAEASASVGVHPGLLAREVCAFAADRGPASTIVLDGGDILGWGLAFARAEQPGSMLFTSDALGTLGVGVPYAVAASMARPDGPTVALIGDGAFGLSAMEIETAVRHDLAPILVVSNNGSWGDVRYEESEWFGATTGTDLSSATRYDQLCVALGGHGERVESPEQLRPALERAAASGVVSVVDVVTDPDRPNEVLRNMGTLNLQ